MRTHGCIVVGEFRHCAVKAHCVLDLYCISLWLQVCRCAFRLVYLSLLYPPGLNINWVLFPFFPCRTHYSFSRAYFSMATIGKQNLLPRCTCTFSEHLMCITWWAVPPVAQSSGLKEDWKKIPLDMNMDGQTGSILPFWFQYTVCTTSFSRTFLSAHWPATANPIWKSHLQHNWLQKALHNVDPAHYVGLASCLCKLLPTLGENVWRLVDILCNISNQRNIYLL